MKSCSNYPFGEEYVGQHIASPYTERFTFTGKERDEQTDYGYFGGRYFDANLMCSWFSVDPMGDKYQSLSPYNYCACNPVKSIDPDGCELDVWIVNLGSNTVTKKEMRDYRSSNADNYSAIIINVFYYSSNFMIRFGFVVEGCLLNGEDGGRFGN